MAGSIPDVISCTMACVKGFFEAESLIPDRLTSFMHSRLAIRLTYIFQFFMASIQLTYSLRYTLLPVIPTFIVFFLAILFTPPPHPVFTIHIYGPQLHGRISTASPLKRVDIACLQYPWPISGWIETRPIRWAMFGCVVVHENTARWRSLNLSPKERAEEEARRRVWREEWGRKSWVGKKLSEMMTELLYVGTGARFLILGGVVLLCMAVL